MVCIVQIEDIYALNLEGFLYFSTLDSYGLCPNFAFSNEGFPVVNQCRISDLEMSIQSFDLTVLLLLDLLCHQ